MLKGEYQHSLDAKGRVIVPAKYREALGDTFILTRGLDSCLFIYSGDEWSKLDGKLKGMPLTKANARSFTRLLYSGAVDCEVDKQGRILIPQNLRKFAGLVKEVVLVGVSDRVEVWDADKWNEFIEKTDEEWSNIAEELMDLD